jgi:hypothetical protein
MSRLLEDRLRMAWEDDRASLLREIHRLQNGASRQQRVIDRIQREFDAVKQLVSARQHDKMRQSQRREHLADRHGQNGNRETESMQVGMKRTRLVSSLGGAVEDGREAGTNSRAYRASTGAAGREASVQAAKVLPDCVLFAEVASTSERAAAGTHGGLASHPFLSPPQTGAAGGVLPHEGELDIQMSPTIPMGTSGSAHRQDEKKCLSCVASPCVTELSASAPSNAVISDYLEASRQIITKGLSTRRRDVRAMLPGHTCVECEKYINVLLQQGIIQTEEEKLAMLQTCSRHKSVVPPPASTPEGFWDLTVHTPDEWNI